MCVYRNIISRLRRWLREKIVWLMKGIWIIHIFIKLDKSLIPVWGTWGTGKKAETSPLMLRKKSTRNSDKNKLKALFPLSPTKLLIKQTSSPSNKYQNLQYHLRLKNLSNPKINLLKTYHEKNKKLTFSKTRILKTNKSKNRRKRLSQVPWNHLKLNHKNSPKSN